MRNSRLNRLVISIAAIGIMAFGLIAATAWSEAIKWTDGGVVKGKKYPHPHAIHLEAMSQRTADFSMDEIRDWPDLLRNLQGKLKILPLSAEAKMVISGFKPGVLNSDEKTIVVNEINRLLMDENLVSQLKGIVAFGSETKKSEAEYNKTRSKEDLKWLNRNIINDIFPQTFRVVKVKELKKITCATCHEAWAPKAGVKPVDERMVTECFSKAITGEKTMQECIEMADILKKSKIEPYGPLKNFIQRSNLEGDVSWLVAVHPETPYTFKPLLKKLVCVECHGFDRKVSKVRGRDGKVKEIPIFYGLGIKKRHEHDLKSAE